MGKSFGGLGSFEGISKLMDLFIESILLSANRLLSRGIIIYLEKATSLSAPYY